MNHESLKIVLINMVTHKHGFDDKYGFDDVSKDDYSRPS